MSFEGLFDSIERDRKEILDQYLLMTSNLPQQLDSLLSQNEKKLELFIENFQQNIVNIKKSEDRDNDLITNTRFSSQQRVLQLQLLENATKMEEQLVLQLKNSLAAMEEVLKTSQQHYQRHQENQNRYEIDLEELNKKMKAKTNDKPQVEIDRDNGRLLLRVDKNGAVLLHEINYNSKEDRFGYAGNNKLVSQAVVSFQFHRDLGRLYSDVLQA